MSNSILLSSKSPRRRELLAQIGVPFDVLDVDVPEEKETGESPQDYVLRLSKDKAIAGAKANSDRPVLGADTIVLLEDSALGDKVLEKPHSKSHAIEMLLSLSANTHQVMTAVAIAMGDRVLAKRVSTRVRFREISPQEAQAYWQTGEPKDKAGGYGIQGLGAVFVESIEGSYSNVVGLPLFETAELLKQFDIPIWK